LADVENLRIDVGRLETQHDFPSISGGFGTVTIAKLDGDLVAVKELRITGDLSNRARFANVRPASECDILPLMPPLPKEICTRAQSMGSFTPPQLTQIIGLLVELRFFRGILYYSFLPQWRYWQVYR
jgi:hypothetical protein